MSKLFLFILLLIPFAAGCGGQANIYERQKEAAAAKRYPDEPQPYFLPYPQQKILRACRQVLESWGYKVESGLAEYGFLCAQSERADSLVTTRIFITPWALFGIGVPRYEEQFSLSANIFVQSEGTGSRIRLSFFREAWDNKSDLLKIEKITDKTFYDKFFKELSEAVPRGFSEAE